MSSSSLTSMIMDDICSAPSKASPAFLDRVVFSSRSSPLLPESHPSAPSSRRTSLPGGASDCGGPLSPASNPCWGFDSSDITWPFLALAKHDETPMDCWQHRDGPVVMRPDNGPFGGYCWPVIVSVPAALASIWEDRSESAAAGAPLLRG